MGRASLPAQLFALIGVATVAAAIHSLVVPVDLTRKSDGGFTVPGERRAEPKGTAPEEPGMEAGEESPPADAAPDQAGGGTPAAEPEAADPGPGESGGKLSLERAAELHELSMMGEPIFFLDARLEREFVEGHVLGALSMPFTRLGDGDGMDVIMGLATPGDGTLFVVYCTGGDCEASEDTAIRLEQLGYTNIAIMADGYDDWAAAGLPVETGDDPTGGLP